MRPLKTTPGATRRLQMRPASRVAAVILSLLPPAAFTGASNLDDGFGQGGRVALDFGPAPADKQWHSNITCMRLLPDGRILASGYVEDSDFQHSKLFVARLLANGNPDKSFGGDGIVLPKISSAPGPKNCGDLALQRDGKYLVTGIAPDPAGSEFALFIARLTPGGKLDTTFADDGVAFFDPDAKASYGSAIVPLDDGTVVVAGNSDFSPDDHREMVVLRYTGAGQLDPAFGTGGVTRISFDAASGYADAFASSLLVRPGGGLLVGGGALFVISGVNTSEFALAALTTDGALDPSYGGTGITHYRATPRNSLISSMLVLAEGSLLAAGTGLEQNGDNDSVLVKFAPGGNPDASFGNAGVAIHSTHPTGGSLVPLGTNSVAGQVNGKLVLAGESWNNSGEHQSTVIRYLDNGQLDPAFGNAGVLTAIFGGGDRLNAVAVQPDGKILVGGIDADSTASLARLRGDPIDPAPSSNDPRVVTTVGGGALNAADLELLGLLALLQAWRQRRRLGSAGTYFTNSIAPLLTT